uniref:Uncharacterized protein n=1 Tax=Coccolithus braarudii TaxID=221442 RepID=A0A7S0Q935_9EUKA|mmetsp:Transcript_6746/g.14722  ORF Transcript_6746/g.14722 Transcript_6746/m.14722 type:complete len:241 (+) Transcript_6746:135-857(+)
MTSRRKNSRDETKGDSLRDGPAGHAPNRKRPKRPQGSDSLSHAASSRKTATSSFSLASHLEATREPKSAETQSAMDSAVQAAWWKYSRKSRQTLVRDYMMVLLLERKNIRFKDYVYQCLLEEKLAELLFEPGEDEGVRDGKLQLIHRYNALLNQVVHADSAAATAEPASPSSELLSPSGRLSPAGLLADMPRLQAEVDAICDGEELAGEHGLSSGSTSDVCGETQSFCSETGTIGIEALI